MTGYSCMSLIICIYTGYSQSFVYLMFRKLFLAAHYLVCTTLCSLSRSMCLQGTLLSTCWEPHVFKIVPSLPLKVWRSFKQDVTHTRAHTRARGQTDAAKKCRGLTSVWRGNGGCAQRSNARPHMQRVTTKCPAWGVVKRNRWAETAGGPQSEFRFFLLTRQPAVQQTHGDQSNTLTSISSQCWDANHSICLCISISAERLWSAIV